MRRIHLIGMVLAAALLSTGAARAESRTFSGTIDDKWSESGKRKQE